MTRAGSALFVVLSVALVPGSACFSDAGDGNSSGDGTSGDDSSSGTTDTTATTDPSASGTSGPTSASGTSQGSDSASGSTGGASDSVGTTTATTDTTDTTDSDTTDSGTSGPGVCPAMHGCYPPLPAGWSGPVAVGVGQNPPPCPDAYPNVALSPHHGLVPGVPQCECSCLLGGVSCELHSQKSNGTWMPQNSCQSPPNEDDCLSAEASGSCTPSVVDEIPEPGWQDAVQICHGPTSAGECDLGECFLDPGPFGDLCVYQDGDLECPADYPDKRLYHQDYDDTRSCSQCSCQPSGQACTIDLEICSVGFYQVELQSGGNAHCLNSSDGDGVSFLGSNVTNQGSCQKAGGQLQGSVMPTGPVTVCCAP